jgi:hypothetical protein
MIGARLYSPELEQGVTSEHRSDKHPIRLEHMLDLGQRSCSSELGSTACLGAFSTHRRYLPPSAARPS